MSKPIPCLIAAGLLALSACAAPGGEGPAPAPPPAGAIANPTVGGAAMDPAQSIGANIARSNEHGSLVAALGAAGLLERLQGSGSFTLFAPSDAAFSRLPTGTMASLTAPASRSVLARLLNYHIVPGSKTKAQMLADIDAGGGAATYQTANGSSIRLSREGGGIVVADLHGNRHSLAVTDVRNSNGVFHVLNGVLIPAT